jgi:hypothetical protein
MQMHDGARTLIFVSNETEQYMSPEDAVDLDEFKFKLAFSAHNYLDPGIVYDDHSLVEWYIEAVEYDGTKDIDIQVIGYHQCTDEDMDEFYDPVKALVDKIEFYKENKNFYCLDDTDIEGKPINTKFFG